MPKKLSPQVRTLLDAFLQHKSLNTLDVYRLDILAPAAVIRELKKLGAAITTTRCKTLLNGKYRTVALYTLEGFTDAE